MRNRLSWLGWFTVVALLATLVASPAYAQGGASTAALSGVVKDSSGGVLPGVDVTAKHNGTAKVNSTVTDGTGRFAFPGLGAGTYTVTVSLSGFKTVVLPDVQFIAATGAAVNVTLEVGKLEETVVVTGATEIVQTQTAAVSTTIAVQQIQSLPVITRTALDYIVSLPGVDTPGSATRSSTINGLSGAAINITLDGINVQDNRSHEGFFMYIRPMMDSVEEITVSTSTPGAEASGQGASTIRMETRAGSNRFSASAYNTWRNQAGTTTADTMARTKKIPFLWRLNTPYWFNKRDIPKTAAGDWYINDVRLQTPGFRFGGPIIKDKLFYFFNVEWFLLPESRSRTRYFANDNARQGIYTYTATNGTTQSINVLALAAGAGIPNSTLDPTLSKLLADIAQATTTTGGVKAYDGNVNQFDFVPSATQKRMFPTLRLDYNVTNSHRLTVSGRYNDFNSQPDFLNSAEARFPGFPNFGGQVSGRYMYQATLRSTLGKTMVNELKGGTQNSTKKGTYFGYGVTPEMFNCSGVGCQSVGGKGWNLSLPSIGPSGLTSATGSGSSSAGVASVFSIEDTLTWLKGKHSLSFGASFMRVKMRNWAMTPYYASLAFGTPSNDSAAYSFFENLSLYPGGANTTISGYARNLYALLTGRVTQITGTAYLGDDGLYHFNGERTNSTTGDDYGVFVSDSWRAKPNLTITGGLRWEFQLPMTTDGLYSRPDTWQMVYGATGAGTGLYGSGNLYHPGVLTGTAPFLVPYENNRPAYKTDWNNIAPSIGATWRPNLKKGILSSILSTDPVFRGGYSLTYTRLGTNFFDGNYSGNPGRTRAASRTATSGTPLFGFDGWPVLLRDTSRLYPSTFPDSPSYPIYPAINETLDIHYPDWPIPSTHQYSFGFQRELGKSMALEVRYVGNTNVGGWDSWNMVSSAQWSMMAGENGFYDEYRLAQANLRANIAAGLGNTFKYTGAAGTSPLPIFMAYLQGIPLNDARNTVPANYTASQFSSSSWYNQLNMYNPNLTGIAGTGSNGLQNGIGTGTGFDANRIAAGLPANFFIANPAVAQGNAYLETTTGNTRFNAIQVELRRRMSHGLLLQSSYQYSFGRKTNMQRSLRENWQYIPSTGGPDHSFKINWVYELPFGRGRAFGNGVSKGLDMLIGGWEFDGIARVQSGSKFNYGGYRLVGMTDKDLQKMFKFYHVVDASGIERIYMFPQDVIQNSILALSTTSATSLTGYSGALPTGRYLAPASGPDCVQYWTAMCPGTAATRIITGPMYWKVDLSLVKRVAIWKNLRVEARMDVFNVFNTINFNATTATGSAVVNWQVTSAATDPSASQDPGGRITSFGLRISW